FHDGDEFDLVTERPPEYLDFPESGNVLALDPANDLRLEQRLVGIRAVRCGVAMPDTLDHPTLPSRLMPMSFCASTANSIGSFWITSLTKPLTISAIASSSGMPRCIT